MSEPDVSKVLRLFKEEVKVINVGLEYFYKELRKQGVNAAHVIWQPKPELEKDLEDILKKIL